jgi:aminopeptidase N
MLDIQTTAAATPAIIRREDYTPPDWLVPEIELDFALAPERTLVTARLHVVRNGAHNRPLRLDGEGLELLSVRVDGTLLDASAYRLEPEALVIPLSGDSALVETRVAISPAANTQLMGLYASGGLLCTQCEAQGFRRITYFTDRPDVLSRYRVRLAADQRRFPILLANGNQTAFGEGEGGAHWAEWEDPFPKPCYLFALVAGELSANRDSFTTMSGRKVALAIWVRAEDLPQTAHAMASLKASMAWDEQVYGREYDLDVFNIVAVSDFNFGAMENKSLNIFNSRYILADPETATDADFDAIAAVVAHEYFHNWSGDRVTCRDWFQLSLKEGFTVYRDQGFSADQGSAAVKRIEEVRSLRAVQFPEDAGPLAHPIRPESYIEISNFYTATVYNKGAEVIRMMATLLGREKFRAGTDLYFDRHDGEAATCEDFVRALEDASGVDLRQFRLWYSQAGTPRVTASLSHDPATRSATLSLGQTVPPTPGQPDKQPMHIPLRVALFGRDSGRPLQGERLIELREPRLEVRFDAVDEPPLLSFNRDFSAPIIVASDQPPEALALLSAHDDDPFARYEAMQQLALIHLLATVRGVSSDPQPLIEAVRATLDDPGLDHAFIAEAVLLPSEAFIGDQLDVVDPDRIHAAREALRHAIGSALIERWLGLHESLRANGFSLSPAAKGARRLRTVALGYIAAAGYDGADAIALRQFDAADNMTDRQGALGVLVNSDGPERQQALDAFYTRHRDNPLVIDKWFATQALSQRAGTLDAVMALATHPDFTLTNPNRLRSLVGSFGANQKMFHDVSGRGYRFVADMVLAVDGINPQTAARLVGPLGRWKRFDAARAALMRAELERIVAHSGLSKDVFEQASKSLS